MLPNQGTNEGVTAQPTNYNANGDNDILSEALRCITSSDPPQNQQYKNTRIQNLYYEFSAHKGARKAAYNKQTKQITKERISNDRS